MSKRSVSAVVPAVPFDRPSQWAALPPWEYLPAEMGCGSGRGMESEDFSDGFHIEHMP